MSFIDSCKHEATCFVTGTEAVEALFTDYFLVNEYLAVNSGEYLCTILCAFTPAWLNASPASQYDIQMARFTRESDVFCAVLRFGYSANNLLFIFTFFTKKNINHSIITSKTQLLRP